MLVTENKIESPEVKISGDEKYNNGKLITDILRKEEENHLCIGGWYPEADSDFSLYGARSRDGRWKLLIFDSDNIAKEHIYKIINPDTRLPSRDINWVPDNGGWIGYAHPAIENQPNKFCIISKYDPYDIPVRFLNGRIQQESRFIKTKTYMAYHINSWNLLYPPDGALLPDGTNLIVEE